MYKPYDKKFDKTETKLIDKIKWFFNVRIRCFADIKYRLKYHTDWRASTYLDDYSLEWLYYHLWRFMEDAAAEDGINLDLEIYLDNEVLTKREACRLLMDKIQRILKETDYLSKEYVEGVAEVFRIYGEIVPWLW